MGRTGKEKIIRIPANSVKAVITADSQILYKDPATNNLLPYVESEYSLPDVSSFSFLLDEGERLSQEDGAYYLLTKKLLENFCFFQMSCNYGSRESDKIREDRARLLLEFERKDFTVYDPDDFFYLSAYFLQKRSATKKMVNYFKNEDNFDRAGAAVRLIASSIIAMRESKVKDWELQADILEMVYCTPENKGINEKLIIESLGLKKDRYFKHKKKGITNLSMLLFGSLPNERGYISPSGETGEELLNILIRRHQENLTKACEETGTETPSPAGEENEKQKAAEPDPDIVFLDD